MVDWPGRWALVPERHKQGFTPQLFCHALSHGVTDNFARINIFDASEIQPSFPGGNIRYICLPDLIRCCGRKVLIQQIRRNRQIVDRVRSRPELAFLLTVQPQLLTKTCQSVTTDDNSVICYLPAPSGAAGFYMFRECGYVPP